MAGGLETALLIGAATGAGTSALTGGDPLKGALFGALGGGITSGLGGALGGAQAGTTAGAATSAGANVGANLVANVADDLALAGSKVGLSAASPGASSFGATNTGIFGNAPGLSPSPSVLARYGMATDPTQLVNTQNQLATAGLKGGNLNVSSVGSTLPPSALAPTTTAPQTGFFDIFKSTPGGPEFKQRLGNYIVQNPGQAAMSGAGLANTLFNQPKFSGPDDEYDGPLKRFRFNPENYRPAFAEGGITDIDLGSTATLSATPVTMMARGGGIADLGGYSDGGRLLKGPGDGMSDSIPARIGRRQPARLADGEFVVPADVVSHLGNGSTDAGAKQLYDMMDKVRRARTGNKKQGREINPRRFVPA